MGLAADVLGRVPLMPLSLTSPHQLRQHQSARFPHGLADAAGESGRKGSNVVEIIQLLWQFGRGKPCHGLGGLSVAETEERRITVAKDSAKRAVATGARRRRKALKAVGATG